MSYEFCEDEDCDCACHGTSEVKYEGPPPTEEELELLYLEPAVPPLTTLLRLKEEAKHENCKHEPRS